MSDAWLGEELIKHSGAWSGHTRARADLREVDDHRPTDGREEAGEEGAPEVRQRGPWPGGGGKGAAGCEGNQLRVRGGEWRVISAKALFDDTPLPPRGGSPSGQQEAWGQSGSEGEEDLGL